MHHIVNSSFLCDGTRVNLTSYVNTFLHYSNFITKIKYCYYQKRILY